MSEQTPDSSPRLRRMASDYEKAVTEARAEQIAARAIARATAHSLHHRRVAVLVTVLSMSLLVGLGVSSANTLPGDSLYGVSRAYEEVGARVGVVNPVERRLNEVIALADRGDTELAARAAEEALAALGYAPDLSVALPPAVTTTTESPDSGDGGNDGRAPATDPVNTTTVEASDEELAETKVRSLRLAAEMVLINMQDNGENLEAAAAELAKAVSGVVTVEEPPVVAEPTTTTSTTVVETTSTTTTESTTTSTTVPDSTTTTVADEEAGEDDGPGPIFLPPSP